MLVSLLEAEVDGGCVWGRASFPCDVSRSRSTGQTASWEGAELPPPPGRAERVSDNFPALETCEKQKLE